MGVMVVGERRTVGMSGTDVGLMSRAGVGDICYDPDTGDPISCPASSVPVTAPTASQTLDAFNAANALNIAQLGLPSSPQAPATSSSTFNWAQLFAPLTSAAGALGTSFAASQLKPGQTLVTGPNGVTTIATAPVTSSLSSLTPLLLIAGGGLLLVIAMKGRG